MSAARTLARCAAVAMLAIAGMLPPGAAAADARTADDAALSRAEWQAVRQVVGDQLDALRAGDALQAFSYAAPGIRERFGTAENFLRMVRGSYTSLLRARAVEFLPGTVVEGAVVQPVRLLANDDLVEVALYSVEKQRDGRWMITGCTLAPSKLRSV